MPKPKWLYKLRKPAKSCWYCKMPFQPGHPPKKHTEKLYHLSCLVLLDHIVALERELQHLREGVTHDTVR